MNNNPTIQELQALLAAEDDAEGTHLICVTDTGDVVIHLLPNCMDTYTFTQRNGVKFHYGMLIASSGYVGPAAAKNEEWVHRLFHCGLLSNWDEGETGYVDCW